MFTLEVLKMLGSGLSMPLVTKALGSGLFVAAMLMLVLTKFSSIEMDVVE